MDIVLSPSPMLRQVCEPCEPGDKGIKRLAKQMARTMYENKGCGLAAPQVGVMKRLVVVDCDTVDETEKAKRDPIYLVNPELVETSGEPVVEEEGCLSCPGILAPVKRRPYAVVRYLDLEGEEWVLEGDGLLGRCLQHEIDHLDGKTLFETCEPAARIAALQAYEEARAAGARPGDTGVPKG
ncbi:MAG: peptide deformylase [Coriobacteriaceae bacterium]|nr:peptide deformylase [Coriobacteriaceae bacterium]